MPKFEPGNRAGRKPGVPNKNSILRDKISSLLQEEMEYILLILPQLKPRARLELFVKLLPYGLAALKPVEPGDTLEGKLNLLNPEQLEQLVNQILENGGI